MGIRDRLIRHPAVFLDRDGTIIRQVELLHASSQLHLLPGAAAAIKDLNDAGYLVVIVTNQPVIARGIISPEDLGRIHAALIGRLARRGARIDAVYFCPHHPQADRAEYRMACACRKPGVGMLLQAEQDLGIDLSRSFFVGDSTQDICAGNRAQVRTILVRTGHGGNDPWQHESTPDFVARNLADAANIIKKVSLIP